MSSWFSELAGKAENILNKIDQNAANVLKNENGGERDQLLEIKCNGDVVDSPKSDNKLDVTQLSASIKRNYSTNALKLPRSQKKLQSVSPDRKSHLDQSTPQPAKNESNLQNIVNVDDDLLSVTTTMQSNASNSSRRSSCSSRTEGFQTVIEYPIEKRESQLKNGTAMHTSSSSNSLQNVVTDEKNELMATKIVLAQVKCERDKLKADILDLENQLETAECNDLIAELTATCDKLTSDNEQLIQKLEKIEQINSTYIKTNSELETTLAKLHQTELDSREKMQWTKNEAEQAAFELQQYRSRAQTTLQMKDDIIAELRAANVKNGTTDTDDAEIDSQCKQHEWLKMTKERETFLEEIKMLRNQLDASKQFINSLELKYHDTESRFNDNEKSLTTALKQEKLRYNQLEDTLRAQANELNVVRDELKRQQILASTQLHEK